MLSFRKDIIVMLVFVLFPIVALIISLLLVLFCSYLGIMEETRGSGM